MKKILLLIILMPMFVINQGCKKHNADKNTNCENLETPDAYFPAFPKSWWNYRNYNNQIIQYKISDYYQNYKGTCYPVFSNINTYVQHNNLIYTWYCGLGTWCKFPSTIYSLNIDTIYICPISFSTLKYTTPGHAPSYRRVTVTIDTALTVLSTFYQNVIVVKEFDIYNSEHRYFDYFSKNIGLIKRDSVNINDTTELIPILTLEDYHIGN